MNNFLRSLIFDPTFREEHLRQKLISIVCSGEDDPIDVINSTLDSLRRSYNNLKLIELDEYVERHHEWEGLPENSIFQSSLSVGRMLQECELGRRFCSLILSNIYDEDVTVENISNQWKYESLSECLNILASTEYTKDFPIRKGVTIHQIVGKGILMKISQHGFEESLFLISNEDFEQLLKMKAIKMSESFGYNKYSSSVRSINFVADSDIANIFLSYNKTVLKEKVSKLL